VGGRFFQASRSSRIPSPTSTPTKNSAVSMSPSHPVLPERSTSGSLQNRSNQRGNDTRSLPLRRPVSRPNFRMCSTQLKSLRNFSGRTLGIGEPCEGGLAEPLDAARALCARCRGAPRPCLPKRGDHRGRGRSAPRRHADRQRRPAHDNALTAVEWSNGEDLNDMLVSKVTETLTQFASVLMPVLCPVRR
jgi:hypothetical protein